VFQFYAADQHPVNKYDQHPGYQYQKYDTFGIHKKIILIISVCKP